MRLSKSGAGAIAIVMSSHSAALRVTLLRKARPQSVQNGRNLS
jgi:hypothetical protein